jgi:phosphopantetheinyl transferase
MPNYAHHTFDGGGIAIWHITETADELYAQLDARCYDAQLAEKKNETRRAEWLAVRLLVKEFFGPDAEVVYHPTGRPYLKDSSIHISISHTRNYAAVAYHYHSPIGVDIEYISNRVERISDRFTSPEEAEYIDVHGIQERQLFHLINWSAKESIYKLLDDARMAEFKTTFHIAPYSLHSHDTLDATLLVASNEKVMIHYRLFPAFVCTWALH